MTTKWAHFSAKPVIHIKKASSQEVATKPRGFWIIDMACEDNWFNWCHGEKWGLSNLRYMQDVSISPRAKMLSIKSHDELLTFTEKYKMPWPDNISNSILADHAWFIDWPTIAKSYHGILITPYQWPARMAHETFWYNGWDCASGCIWEPRAVQILTMRVNFRNLDAI